MISSLLRGAVPASRRLLAPALALVAVAFATSAQAQPVTFAQFTQARGTGNPFVFTNNTTNATFSASTTVNFEFIIDGPGLPTGDQRAILTLSSSTTAPVVASPTGTRTNLEQPLNGALTLSIIRESDRANLLTATSSASTLGGPQGARGVGLQASQNAGDNVVFTSSFLNFTNTMSRTLALAFSSLISAGGGGLGQTGNFLTSFTAAGSGTFSSEPAPVVVPEPASMVMMGLGLAAIPGLVIARRKRAARIA